MDADEICLRLSARLLDATNERNALRLQLQGQGPPPPEPREATGEPDGDTPWDFLRRRAQYWRHRQDQCEHPRAQEDCGILEAECAKLAQRLWKRFGG